MDPEENVLEDRPEPGWKERIAAMRRAAAALLTTRAEIFREELSEKRSLFTKAAIGLALAAVFGVLAFLLLTALVAAIFSRLLGGPIAGITAALLLYVLIAAAAAILGGRTLSRVRPFAFPATEDEIRKDLDAVKEHAAVEDEAASDALGVCPSNLSGGPCGPPNPLAAERASIRPGDEEGDDKDVLDHEEMSEIEDRFRAGSE
jgi:uncharacterized membrane protein YqjE